MVLALFSISLTLNLSPTLNLSSSSLPPSFWFQCNSALLVMGSLDFLVLLCPLGSLLAFGPLSNLSLLFSCPIHLLPPLLGLLIYWPTSVWTLPESSGCLSPSYLSLKRSQWHLGATMSSFSPTQHMFKQSQPPKNLSYSRCQDELPTLKLRHRLTGTQHIMQVWTCFCTEDVTLAAGTGFSLKVWIPCLHEGAGRKPLLRTFSASPSSLLLPGRLPTWLAHGQNCIFHLLLTIYLPFLNVQKPAPGTQLRRLGNSLPRGFRC